MQFESVGLGRMYAGCGVEMMRQLGDDSVDMIFTDPPYKTISGGPKAAPGYGWRSSVLKNNDGKIFEHNDISPDQYLPEMYRVLKPGSHAYVMTNNLNLRETLCAADDAGFGFHNLLVWRKNTCTANRWYMKEMELVLFFYKRPAKKINNQGTKQIFEADNPRNKIHPTQKPVELPEHYILNSSGEGDVVLDPFAGSGSTAVAAAKNGRRWLSAEIDPDYYSVALNSVREVSAGWDLV